MKQPAVLHRGLIKRWIGECMEKKEEHRWAICNTEEEITGKEIGHWVMLEWQCKESIRIWDPLGHKIAGITQVEKQIKESRCESKFSATGKQKEGWSCGYHMIKWTEELMTHGGKWDQESPNTLYNTEEAVEDAVHMLKELAEPEKDEQKESPAHNFWGKGESAMDILTKVMGEPKEENKKEANKGETKGNQRQ